MLHPINPPNCIREMGALIILQQKTLEFACANSRFTDAAFKVAIGEDFVGWLDRLKFVGGKTSKTANRFFQELDLYLKVSSHEKSQILQEFISDQKFCQRFTDSTFTFSLLPGRSDAHARARDFLVEFYEFLGIGFPSVLVGYSPTSPPFKRENVVNGYKATNPDVEYVCPCCDNAFTDDPSADEQGYTLEHYFPRSLYPSICLHPLNLIPMCSGCNSRKKDIDPLTPSISPLIQVPYSEIFHPISRPVRILATLGFKSDSTMPVSMEFIAKNPPPGYEKSIEAYKLMYQIPDRWSANWRRVDNRVSLYVKRALKRVGISKVDDQSFDLVLLEAITELEENFGKDHLNYPAAKWLAWAKVNQFQDLKRAFVGA